MRIPWLRSILAVGLATAAMFCSEVRTQADSVFPGYDLFQSVTPGTNFGGVDFAGVPLGTYDFGGTIGVQNVGLTDTIVQRLDLATAAPGASATIPIELVALQLVSTTPVDFGLGPDFYYITLQSARGGPASPGEMTINFADPTPGPPPPPQPVGGTFDSFFDVFFDIRKGALDGPIALSDDLVLTNTGSLWSHYPAPGSLLIDGVNHDLNGRDGTNDFFAIQAVVETHPTGAMHTVIGTGVQGGIPEPSSLTLGGIAVAFGVGLTWYRRRRTS
jgi:hypothetical protein